MDGVNNRQNRHLRGRSIEVGRAAQGEETSKGAAAVAVLESMMGSIDCKVRLKGHAAATEPNLGVVTAGSWSGAIRFSLGGGGADMSATLTGPAAFLGPAGPPALGHTARRITARLADVLDRLGGGDKMVEATMAATVVNPKEPLLSDRSLLDGFRAGDRRALREVYLAYSPHVYAVLRHGFAFNSGGQPRRFSGCKTEHDTEEMMQEAFRRAFEEKARIRYDGLRPFRHYIAFIARNLVIDDLRKKRPELGREEDAGQTDVDVAPSPEAKTFNNELKDLIATFRKGLDETSVQVFDLRFGAERDQEVTAKEMGLSVYKVRKLERQIRKGLLVHLKRAGYSPAQTGEDR